MAQVESSDGITMSGLGRFFVCLESSGTESGMDNQERTRSNQSFSRRSMMISKVSQETRSPCSFLRSAFTLSSHSISIRSVYNKEFRNPFAEDTLLIHVILDLHG